MATTWSQYKRSLREYEETMAALRLRMVTKKLANTKFRLTRVENAQAAAREQQRHSEALDQQDRTVAIQEHLRSRMNNRWAR